MENPVPQEKIDDSRESAWAPPVSHLSVGYTPEGAINLNVDGRRIVSPLQGFGQLWRKTYRVRLSGVNATPQEVIRYWKEHLPDLMPADSRFYPSLTGVKPGEVVLINATLPGFLVGIPVSTGILILYSDDESFTVMTPEGHPESGFNTFSAFEEEGATVAQIQSLGRANDPVFEFGYRFMGGAAQQEKIWNHVLTALAAHFGINGQVVMQKSCLDARVQWSQAGNVWHNSALRTMINTPVRVVRRLTRQLSRRS
jgi:hypothetical protein